MKGVKHMLKNEDGLSKKILKIHVSGNPQILQQLAGEDQ